MPNLLSDLLRDSLRDNCIWVNIKGNSMRPFLKDGDIALVEKAGRFLNSDVIVFRQKGGDIISHRLIRRIKGKDKSILYQTMADNGICLDAPVGRYDVIGRVIAVEKDGRVVRIDTISGYIKNLIYWCKDIIKLVICKYGGKALSAKGGQLK